MSETLVTDVLSARRWKVSGSPPWFGAMAQVMAPSQSLLDRTVNDFAPIGTRLQTQQTWWIVLHMFVVDRLVTAEMAGRAAPPLRESAWLSYATAYWGLAEPKSNGGTKLPVELPAQKPNEQSVAMLVRELAKRHAALASDQTALDALPALLADTTVVGFTNGFAYNSGYMEAIGEGPPLGVRPTSIRGQDGLTRINDRDELRCDYAIPVPDYLRKARTDFEVAVDANPGPYQQLLAASGLAANWRNGIATGKQIWGAPMLTGWPQARYDSILAWSVRYNFALEAPALTAVTACLTRDAAAAKRAIRANAITLGYWGTAAMALQDPKAHPPKVVPA
jgi:hypothetical protein